MRGTQAGLLNRSTGNGNSSSLLLSAKFISVKCYQVALAVWGGRVQVRILAWRPSLCAGLDVTDGSDYPSVDRFKSC